MFKVWNGCTCFFSQKHLQLFCFHLSELLNLEGWMQKGCTCFFSPQHLEPFCFHLLELLMLALGNV